MKKRCTRKVSLFILSILGINNLSAFEFMGTSFFNPRSQSTNVARDLVGWHSLINRYDPPSLYGAVSITPSFGQILRQRRAAEAIFGTDIFSISGSLVPDRSLDDVLADYFGLSPSFSSIVEFKPFIRTGQIDFGFYLGLHDFYFRMH